MNVYDSAITCPRCGDELPWPNRPRCDRQDCPERTSMALELLTTVSEPNPAWLIEIAPPIGDTLYYCAPGDWCSNPNHAHRFPTKADAEAIRAPMRADLTRVAEHEWSTPESQKDTDLGR